MTAAPVLAQRIPSPSQVARQLEQRYHLNLQSMQNQGENFNIADTKKMAPQVTLSFSPVAPQIGEKITATASPLYFSTATESMYFTWYLKHNSSGGDDGRGNRDHNNDGDVDIEDYKIEAMRLIANAGFNSANANYGTNVNDNDGYRAYFGGNDRNEMPDHCYIHDFSSGKNYELMGSTYSYNVTCPAGSYPVCAETNSTIDFGGSTSGERCSKLDESPYCSEAEIPVCSSGTAYCSAINTDPIDSSASCSTSANIISTPTCNRSGRSGGSRCRHLFPNAPGYDTGDNSFSRGEERFWRTNPEDPDTANNGNKDEANVAGLGQFSLSWNYQPGDKVGVVAEGVSNFPTKYDDSSQMVMWAFPKNDCEPENTGSMTRNIKGYNVVIPTAEKDLDDCLEDNLVDPLEEGNFPKMEVALSYEPKNPINDSSGNNNDELVVNSSVSGATDNRFLNYRWTVSRNDEISLDDADWEIYTKAELDALDVGTIQGIGVSALKLKMKFASPPRYLKVSLSVSESINARKTAEGRSSVIIPVFSTSNRIRAYPVNVSSSLNLSLRSGAGSEICTSSLNRVICPIVKNELVGLTVSEGNLTDFLWTLDGAPFPLANVSCSLGECVSATGAATNVAYFPVLKEKGERYDIGLTAVDSRTGQKIVLSRTFEVVDPRVKIVSADNNAARPLLLGNYIDLNGTSWPDYSEDDFDGLTGSSIVLSPQIDIPLVENLTWYIDGFEMNSHNLSAFGASVNPDNNNLTFPALKNIGESYTVGVRGLYTQDNNTKRYLNEYWGVQLNEFYETPVEDAVDIAMAGSFASQTTGGSPKVLATLVAGIPGYIAFLFRIILTTALILVSAWIFMSLTPQKNTDEN